MLTQKLSIKRHIVVKKYEAQIEELYASGACARGWLFVCVSGWDVC